MTESSAWRTLGRLVVSLCVLVLIAAWAAFATFLMVFQCDENCAVPGPQPNAWQYTTQGVVALVGAGLGVLALGLGFRRYRFAYVIAGSSALVALVVWLYLTQHWTL